MRDDYQESINSNFDVGNTQGIEINALKAKRKNSNYTCKDQNWQTRKYQGDIYMSVSNDTHNEILKHHESPDYKLPEHGYPGTSGFFLDEESASKHFSDDGKFDSVSYGHAAQQAPYFDNNKAIESRVNKTVYNPDYNSHLDCFRENPKKMKEHFGTSDFYAAMSKCTENTPWGEGGATQGYNPYINEMINKGCLEYIPEKSRTCDNNACTDYYERKKVASVQASEVNDYIEQNNIKGEPGQKLGYNELNRTNTINAASANNSHSNTATSQNVAATTGGGSNAPPVTATDTERYPIKNDGNNGKVTTNNADGFYNAKVSTTNNSSDVTQGINKTNTGFNM